jgi:hypothetical protein
MGGAMADDRLEVVLHQPFFKQRALSEGAPDLAASPVR